MCPEDALTPDAWREEFSRTWEAMRLSPEALAYVRGLLHVQDAPALVQDVQDTANVIVQAADVLVCFVLFNAAPNTSKSPVRAGEPHQKKRVSWARFCAWLALSKPGDPSLDPGIAKRACGAWVAGRYSVSSGHDGLAQAFLGLWMLVLDVDAGDPLLVAELLKKFTCVIHSTYKHGPKQGRCRIVFLLAEECRSARDLNDARVYLETWLAKYTITAPAKDAATGRLAYLPMHQEGTAPVCIVNTGKRVDLQALLVRHRQVRAAQAAEAPSRSRSRGRSGVGVARSPEYTARALKSAAENVSQAKPGERQRVLVREGASLSRPELQLTADEVLEVLLPAAEHADPDEDPAELARHVSWGLKKGGLL